MVRKSAGCSDFMDNPHDVFYRTVVREQLDSRDFRERLEICDHFDLSDTERAKFSNQPVDSRRTDVCRYSFHVLQPLRHEDTNLFSRDINVQTMQVEKHKHYSFSLCLGVSRFHSA